MSEKISRRVFLKTTGFAALSVAAAGVLGGCDVSPLPGNATLTDFGEALPVAAQDNMSYSISATPLSEEWHSYAAAFESDEKIHYYIYFGLRIETPTKDFKIKKSNLSCSAGKVFGFGNITLNDSNKYSIPTEWTVKASYTKAVPVYIDLGDVRRSSLSSLEIKLTVSGKTIPISYSPLDTPAEIKPQW